MRKWIVTVALALMTLTYTQTFAQTAPLTDAPSTAPIEIGIEVEGTITDTGFYDRWMITLNVGDLIRVTMGASEGLIPLIGILSAGGDLLQRSADGTINGTVQVEYQVVAPGMYTISAARVGLDTGTSSGQYTLRVDLISRAPDADTYADVVFRCQDDEATTLSIVEFTQPSVPQFYTVTMIGVDGLLPAFKIETTREGDIEPCWDQVDVGAIYSMTLPSGDSYTQSDSLFTRLNIDAAVDFGMIRVTFASRDGSVGRYIAFVEGFSVAPPDALNTFALRHGPLAAVESALDVYMIRANASSRLDPFIEDQSTRQSCDDAGRRGCETIPRIEGAGLVWGDLRLIGGRFDAGLRFEAGDLELRTFAFGSRSGRTSGDYTLMLVGELQR